MKSFPSAPSPKSIQLDHQNRVNLPRLSLISERNEDGSPKDGRSRTPQKSTYHSNPPPSSEDCVAGEPRRSTIPSPLRCLWSLLYRLWLTRIRAPWSLVLDAVIPVGVVLLLLWPRSRLVPTSPDELRYLTDDKYALCPFAAYGPRLNEAGVPIESVTLSDGTTFTYEDVICQRLTLDHKAARAAATALAGQPTHGAKDYGTVPDAWRDNDLGSLDGGGESEDDSEDESEGGGYMDYDAAGRSLQESKGGVDGSTFGAPFRPTLLPFLQTRVYSPNHFISLLMAEQPVDGIYFVGADSNDGCKRLADSIENFLFKLLPTDDNITIVGEQCLNTTDCDPDQDIVDFVKLPNLEFRLQKIGMNSPIFGPKAATTQDHAIIVFICSKFGRDEGTELTLRINPLAINGSLPEVDVASFPFDNRDIIHDGLMAVKYSSSLSYNWKPSFLDFSLLVGGYALEAAGQPPLLRQYLQGTPAVSAGADIPIHPREVELLRLYPSVFDSIMFLKYLHAERVWSLSLRAIRALCLICSPEYELFKHRNPPECAAAPLLFEQLSPGSGAEWENLIELDPVANETNPSLQRWCSIEDVVRFYTSVAHGVPEPPKDGGDDDSVATDSHSLIEYARWGRNDAGNPSERFLRRSVSRVERFLRPSWWMRGANGRSTRSGRQRRALASSSGDGQEEGEGANNITQDLKLAVGIVNLLASWSQSLLVPLRTEGISLQFKEVGVPSSPAWLDKFNAMFLRTTIWGAIWVSIYLFPLRRIIKRIMADKDFRVREVFKIFGCSEGIIWLSIYLFEGFTLALLALILAFAAIPTYPSTSIWLTFILLWTFGISCISYCVLVSALFTRPRTALIFGIGIFYLLYNPYSVIESSYKPYPASKKKAFMLFFTAAFSWGHQTLLGLQVSGFKTPPNLPTSITTTYKGVSVATVCGFLMIDAVLYFVLGWYLHQVFPGESGVARPWHFPLSSTIRYLHRLRLSRKGLPIMPGGSEVGDGWLGAGATDGRALIEVSHLKKVFAQRNILGKATGSLEAVKDVSFSVNEGEIYALLGHNGAGKTTVIGMLIGMLSMTEGTVKIGGYDIHETPDKARQNIGYCPQFNILFDLLTVEEHLKLYGFMKGVQWGDLNDDIDGILGILNIGEKKHALSKTLSGGQKRRLSVSTALIGHPRAIILDEPSTGLDPFTRRALWDTLRTIKESRALLLTTHFMEEADYLGDQIGIMAYGTLRCQGSPLALKSEYGTGYLLTTAARATDCPPEPPHLRETLLTSIPGSCLDADTGAQVSYKVPLSGARALSKLLSDLQSDSKVVDNYAFSLSVMTVERVFLAVTKKAEEEERAKRDATNTRSPTHCCGKWGGRELKYSPGSKSTSRSDDESGSRPISQPDSRSDVFSLPPAEKQQADKSCCSGTSRVLKSLLIKRALIARRDFYGLFCQIILPISLVLFFLSLTGVLIGPLSQHSVDFISELSSVDGIEYLPQTIYYGIETGVSSELEKQITRMMDQGCGGSGSSRYFRSVPIRDKAVSAREMEDFIMEKRHQDIREDVSNYNALFFGKEVMHVIHDGRYVHSLPLGLVMLMNCATGGGAEGSGAVPFRLAHHPLPRDDGYRAFLTRLAETVWVIVGISIIPTYWGSVAAAERQSQAKHAQHMAGVRVWQYWLAMWIWDMISFLVPFLVILILLFSYKVESVDSHHLPSTLIISLAYGLVAGPFTYALSLAFGSPLGSQSLMGFLGLFCSVFVSTIQLVTDTAIVYQDWLQYIVLLIPQAAIAQALLSQSWFWAPGKGYQDPTFRNSDENASIWALSVVGLPLIYLLLETLALAGLVLCVDSAISNPAAGASWRKKKAVRASVAPTPPPAYKKRLRALRSLSERTTEEFVSEGDTVVDQDVREEEERCAQYSDSALTQERRRSSLRSNVQLPPILIHKLSKTFRSRKAGRLREGVKKWLSFKRKHGSKKQGGATERQNVAVQRLSFLVESGECFGFLGVNGAGKTTSIQMLVGMLRPTSGEAWLGGQNITKDMTSAWQKTGYCPQFDALFDFLTIEEHLVFYARLAGVDEKKPGVMSGHISRILNALGIAEDKRCLARFASGGLKRKLSVALALMRDPAVVLLDEPTSGVDPAARRRLWGVIRETTASSGRALLLTTHSMEECEALCDRLAIMDRGRLLCIGSSHHLKARFGQSYQLEVTFEDDSLTKNEDDTNDKIFDVKVDRGGGMSKDEGAMLNTARTTMVSTAGDTPRAYDNMKQDNDDDDNNMLPTQSRSPLHCTLKANTYNTPITLFQSSSSSSSPFGGSDDNNNRRTGRMLSSEDGPMMRSSPFAPPPSSPAISLSYHRQPAALVLRSFLERACSSELSSMESSGRHARILIPKSALERGLPQLFDIMEDNKDVLGISEYSIADASLDSIFIQFNRSHQDDL